MADIDNEIAVQEIEINILHGRAEASAKSIGPSIPGIGDVAKTAEDEIKKEAKKHAKAIKMLGGVLLLAVVTGAAINNPEIVNKQIDNFNKFTDKIRSTIETLKTFLKKIFPIIKIITIAYIAAKIISQIPAITIGLGAGTAFTTHIAISDSVKTVCQMLIDKIGKIPFTILAIIAILLSLIKFIDMIMGIINNFSKQQDNLKNDQISDSLLSSNELGDIKDNTDTDILDESLQLVECTLPNGEVRQMTAEECIDAGGTFPGMNLLSQLNDCNLQLRNCAEKDMNSDECIKLKLTYDDLFNEIGNLSGLQLNDNIITSLKYLNSDVTIEKATKRKGKRYGFYQSDINKSEK